MILIETGIRRTILAEGIQVSCRRHGARSGDDDADEDPNKTDQKKNTSITSQKAIAVVRVAILHIAIVLTVTVIALMAKV